MGYRWALDVARPLPETQGKNNYVIAAVEYLTRDAVAAPVANHTANDIAKLLMKHNLKSLRIC